MAISKDTTALVAAQLTVAWSNLYATKHAAVTMDQTEVAARVAEQYEQFRKAVAEVDIPKGNYDMRSLIG